MERENYKNHVITTNKYIGNVISGEIVLETKFNSDQMIDLENSYFALTAKVTKTATFAINEGISTNVFSNLFKSASCYFGTELISEIMDVPTHNTIIRVLRNNTEYENSSGSPIHFFDNSPNINNSIYSINSELNCQVKRNGAVFYSHFDAATNALVDYQYGTAVNATGPLGAYFHSTLPFTTMFLENASVGDNMLLHGNIKLTVRLQFSNSYLQNMFNCAQPVSLSIENFELNVPTYKIRSIPASIADKKKYIECYSNSQNCSGMTSFYYLPPSSVHRISICFTPISSLSDDYMMFENIISKLSINYASTNYPSLQYSFSLSNTDRDMMKAYQDYRVYSDAESQAESSLLTFQQYRHHPIYVFSTTPAINSNNLNLNVFLEYHPTVANASNYNINVLCEMLYELHIERDEYALVKSISKRPQI